MNDRILNMLSIGKKAGKVCSGEFQTEDAVRKGTAKLVIYPEDASANTKKSIKDITEYYKVPSYSYGTKESLGHAIGCTQRSSVTVMDEGIAAKLINLLKNIGGTLNGEY